MNGRSGAKREKGEETGSKHQIQPGVENERVNAGGDDRICLSKPNSRARTVRRQFRNADRSVEYSDQ